MVGGGLVALRKVKALLEHGAKVEVISPDLCPEMIQLAESGAVHVLHRNYVKGDLEGALISVAATDDSKKNEEISEESRRSGVLVNVVDDRQYSDFITPSYLRRGDITIAVSTGGKSPALARRIRARLEEDFGAEYAALALLANKVRSELKQEGISVDSDAWQEALDLDLLVDMIRDGRNEEAEATLINSLKKLGKKK